MVAEKRRDRSRIALGSLLLLGSYVGCFPDFDALSSARDDEGGEAGVGGATGGSTGSGGTTGDAGIGGEGGESAGNGGTGNATGGNATGGSSKGGSNTGGSSKGGNSTGGKGGSSGGKGGGAGAGGTTAGQAGTGGAMATGGAGAGGGGAEAGAGGGGAAAGTGGAGGQTCTEPMGVTASGVEKLMVPLTAVGQGQRFNVQNRSSPSMPYDLSGATVTIRAYAPCAIGGNLSIFFRSTSVTESPAMRVALATLVAGFVDIAVPVPELTGTFDPTLVDVVRIEVEADPAYGYDFQSPATVVYIDSVVSSNGAVTHPFDVAPVNLEFGSSGARPLDGTSYIWLSQYP